MALYVLLAMVAALVIYLFYAVIHPEKFRSPPRNAMTSQGWLQIGLTLLTGLLISIPVGRYLAMMVTGRKTVVDRLFDPIDNFDSLENCFSAE